MFRKIISVLLCASMTVGLLAFLSKVTELKNSENKYHELFEEKERIDVLFLGTSHVINAVKPLELWEDYGLSSYNCGGHSNRMATSYWVMENALDYTSPKLLVIDGFTLSFNQKHSENWSFVHLSMDAFPLSRTKIRAALDLTDDATDYLSEGSEKPGAMSLIWNFSTYHSRWSELTKADFAEPEGFSRGAEDLDMLTAAEAGEVSDARYVGDGLGVQYLRKMIEDARSRGIDVLLIYLPFTDQDTAWIESNTMADIAAEYGLPYINFQKEEVVDYATDFADGGIHLNPLGAEKITDYLGSYIREHYDIPDRRDCGGFAGWDKASKDYADFRDYRIACQSDLSTYMMLMGTETNDLIIALGDSSFPADVTQQKLLRTLGADPEQIGPETEFVVIRKGEATDYVKDLLPEGGSVDTALGALGANRRIAEDGGIVYDLELNGLCCLTLSEPDINGPTVSFLVFDGNGSINHSAVFSENCRRF